MKTSESIDKIAPALVAARAEMGNLPSDSVNPHFKSKFTSLPKLIEHVDAILAKHDLAVMQMSLGQTASGSFIETVVMHKTGQWISDEGNFVPNGKGDAQGQGSATTYNRRYGLAAFFGIATDDDDDGNAASSNQGPVRARQNASNGSGGAKLVSAAQAAEIVELTKMTGWKGNEATLLAAAKRIPASEFAGKKAELEAKLTELVPAS